jgi:hypothetical protein
MSWLTILPSRGARALVVAITMQPRPSDLAEWWLSARLLRDSSVWGGRAENPLVAGERFPRSRGRSRSWSDWAKGGAGCDQTEQVRAGVQGPRDRFVSVLRGPHDCRWWAGESLDCQPSTCA